MSTNITMADLQKALEAVTEQLDLTCADQNDRIKAQEHHITKLEQVNNMQAVNIAELKQSIVKAETAYNDLHSMVTTGAGNPMPLGTKATPPPRLPNLFFLGRTNDDWLSFKDSFLNLAMLQKYTDEQAKRILRACMQGPAVVIIQHINPGDIGMTLDQMLAKYEALFVPPSACNTNMSRFESAMQLDKEGVQGFHGRLHLLGQRAYGKPPDQLEPRTMIRAFLKGLRSKTVRNKLLSLDPQTFEEALVFAMRETSAIESQVYYDGGAAALPKVGPMNFGGSQQLVRAEPMEIGALQGAGSSGRCFLCNLFGHQKKDCPKLAMFAKAAGVAPGANAGTTAGRVPFRKRTGAMNKTDKGRPVNRTQRLAAMMEDITMAIAEMNMAEGDDDPDEDQDKEDLQPEDVDPGEEDDQPDF